MRKYWIPAVGMALALAACAQNQVSATALSAYDAAVSAEEVALATGKITPAQATTLRACRVAAYNGVQAVVAAEKGGGSAAGTQTYATATAAIAGLSAAAANPSAAKC